MMVRVLLLDGHTVQALSVARSLKSAGYKVTAIIESRISYGYASRYVDEKIIYKSDEISDFLSFLLDFLKKNPQDVILPLYNDSAEFLSKHKERIEEETGVKCAVTDIDTFMAAHDKSRLMEICRVHGLPHPRTANISYESVKSAVEYVGFPAMIKPNISAGAKGIVLVKDEGELSRKLPEILDNYGPSTLQEYIDHNGVYYNVMLYRDRNGKSHGGVVLEIMRYFPLKGGTSCYCKTIRNDALVDVCRDALNSLNWWGFADFDLMQAKDGSYKIIEINPRVPASIHGAAISNVNFPQLIVEDCTGLPLSEVEYMPDKEMRFMGLDVMWFVFSPCRFSFSPSWFKFWGKNIFYQDGSFKDPLPMLMGCVSGILKYLNPAVRRAKLNK